MQLSEDRINWIANVHCQGGTAYPSQVKSAIREALAEALRAQADARPVGEWVKHRHWNAPHLKWAKGYVAHIGDKLYTHPEASAPGLSREDSDLLRELLYRVEYDPGSPTEEKLHQAYEIITRGRAATLRLPPTTGLPQAAHCASAATVAEPRDGHAESLLSNLRLANKTTRNVMEERDSMIRELRKKYSAIEIADMVGLTRQRVHQILKEVPSEAAQQQAEPGVDEVDRLMDIADEYAERSAGAVCATTAESMDCTKERDALEHALRAAFAAQSGQRAGVAEEWIPVDERMPEDDTGPLLVTNNLGARDAYGHMSHLWLVNRLHAKDDRPAAFARASQAEVEFITHWRPAIPAAPTQQQEGGDV